MLTFKNCSKTKLSSTSKKSKKPKYQKNVNSKRVECVFNLYQMYCTYKCGLSVQ